MLSWKAVPKSQGREMLPSPLGKPFGAAKKELPATWATETSANHVDTVWPYWNLFDFTPEGRPERDLPPQKFRSLFLEEHYLNKG